MISAVALIAGVLGVIPASAAGASQPSQCADVFSGSTSLTAESSNPQVEIHYGTPNLQTKYYANSFRNGGLTDYEPVRYHVRSKIEKLAESLTLSERLLIYDRLIESEYGIFQQFGKSLVHGQISSGQLRFAQDYEIRGNKSLIQHPNGKTFLQTGSGGDSYASAARQNRADQIEVERAAKRLAKDELDWGATDLMRKHQWYLLTRMDRISRLYVILWRKLIAARGKQVSVSFNFLIDHETWATPIASRSTLVDIRSYSGKLDTMILEHEVRTEAQKFSEWLTASPAREAYAQLVLSLALERHAEVIAGRNGGRIFNDGKLIPAGHEASPLKDAFKKLVSIGSDKSSTRFLDRSKDDMRSDASAVKFEYAQSLIHPVQVSFERAPHHSSLPLLGVNPSFEAFKESAERHLAVADMMTKSLSQQVERAETLKMKIDNELGAGNVGRESLEYLNLLLIDFGKSKRLLSDVHVAATKHIEFLDDLSGSLQGVADADDFLKSSGEIKASFKTKVSDVEAQMARLSAAMAPLLKIDDHVEAGRNLSRAEATELRDELWR